MIAGDTVPCAGLDELCRGADVYVQTVLRDDLVRMVPMPRFSGHDRLPLDASSRPRRRATRRRARSCSRTRSRRPSRRRPTSGSRSRREHLIPARSRLRPTDDDADRRSERDDLRSGHRPTTTPATVDRDAGPSERDAAPAYSVVRSRRHSLLTSCVGHHDCLVHANDWRPCWSSHGGASFADDRSGGRASTEMRASPVDRRPRSSTCSGVPGDLP